MLGLSSSYKLIFSFFFSFQIDPKVAFPRRTHPKVRKTFFLVICLLMATPPKIPQKNREMTIVAAANFTSLTRMKNFFGRSQMVKDKPDCGQEVAKGQTWALKVCANERVERGSWKWRRRRLQRQQEGERRRGARTPLSGERMIKSSRSRNKSN